MSETINNFNTIEILLEKLINQHLIITKVTDFRRQYTLDYQNDMPIKNASDKYCHTKEAYLQKWLALVGLTLSQIPQITRDIDLFRNESYQLRNDDEFKYFITTDKSHDMWLESMIINIITISKRLDLTNHKSKNVFPIFLSDVNNKIKVNELKNDIENFCYYKPDSIRVLKGPFNYKIGYIVIESNYHYDFDDLYEIVYKNITSKYGVPVPNAKCAIDDKINAVTINQAK